VGARVDGRSVGGGASGNAEAEAGTGTGTGTGDIEKVSGSEVEVGTATTVVVETESLRGTTSMAVDEISDFKAVADEDASIGSDGTGM
jgi:hypothetical protein